MMGTRTRVSRAFVAGALLAATALASIPTASAGCGYLLETPSGCVTAMYENEKRFVGGKVVGMQGWSGGAIAGAPACASVPSLSPEGGEGPVALTEAWIQAEQAELAAFQSNVARDFGGAAARLIGQGWGLTAAWFLAMDAQAADLLMGAAPPALVLSPESTLTAAGCVGELAPPAP